MKFFFLFLSSSFYRSDVLKKTGKDNTTYSLTEWEGQTGKYLAQGQEVRTYGSVSSDREPNKYFPVRTDLTQSISILSYDHLLVLKILKLSLNLNRTRLHNIRRPRAEQLQKRFYLTNRFHVAVRLFSNRSQMTSKCGKNKKVAHEALAECVTDVLTTF